jgi:hypothetical protein
LVPVENVIAGADFDRDGNLDGRRGKAIRIQTESGKIVI